MLQLLVRHAPERLPGLAGSFLKESDGSSRAVSADCCRLLLECDAKQFEPVVTEAVLKERSTGAKARGLAVLEGHFPEKYLDVARQENLAALRRDSDYYDLLDSFRWLVTQFREGVLREVEPYWALVQNLGTLASELGAAAAPGMIAAARHPDHDVRLEALSHLAQWGDPKHDDAIREGLLAGLGGDDAHVVRYIGLAGRWKPQMVAGPLWKLFEHKSKPVRQAAARALARGGR